MKIHEKVYKLCFFLLSWSKVLKYCDKLESYLLKIKNWCNLQYVNNLCLKKCIYIRKVGIISCLTNSVLSATILTVKIYDGTVSSTFSFLQLHISLPNCQMKDYCSGVKFLSV